MIVEQISKINIQLRKVTFIYENDRLELVLNSDGKGMSFAYDDVGNLLKITDFAATDCVTNEYDV